jgi:Mrp family chromosome partitioning ATPase
VDSPPVLSVTDALILAQKVDGVLLVAEAGKVRTDALRSAVAALESVKAPMLGVVLNKMSQRGGAYYYSGYYSARYTQAGARSARNAAAAQVLLTNMVKQLTLRLGRLLSKREQLDGSG